MLLVCVFRQPGSGGAETPVEQLSSPHPRAVAPSPRSSGCPSFCVHVTLLNPEVLGSTIEVIQRLKVTLTSWQLVKHSWPQSFLCLYERL